MNDGRSCSGSIRNGPRKPPPRKEATEMLDPNMVPNIDPNPLPAPYWVFKLLLIVTFFLHILAMNCMLGGAALALLARWRQGTNKFGNRIFFDVAKKVPV